METFETKHRVNCGELSLRQSAAKPGYYNQERSSTIPQGSTIKRLEAHDTLSSQVEGDEMVTSAWRHAAARKGAALSVATQGEDFVPTNRDRYLPRHFGWSRWWSIWRTRKCRRSGSDEQRKWSRIYVPKELIPGSVIAKSMMNTPLIAGKSGTDDQQRSPITWGTFNDYLRKQSRVKRPETGSTQTSNVVGKDIVSTVVSKLQQSYQDGQEISVSCRRFAGRVTRKFHVLYPVGVWCFDSSNTFTKRRSDNDAWVSLTPLQSAMIVEKFREFSGTLRDETILSEAWSSDQERATTIPEVGVGCKLLASEARNTSHRGDDLVSSAWRHAAAHDGAVLTVASENEEFDYKSVIEIA